MTKKKAPRKKTKTKATSEKVAARKIEKIVVGESELSKKLARTFRGLEIIEATTPLRLQPKPCDAENAIRKSETDCIFAKCAIRMFDATRVIFWNTRAYIDLVCEDGVRRVHRFHVTPEMRALIAKFDDGQPFEIGRAFILLPPAENQTLEKIRANSKAYRQSVKGRAVMNAHGYTKTYKQTVGRLENVKAALVEAKSGKKEEKIERLTARVIDLEERVDKAKEKSEAAWMAANALKNRRHNYGGRSELFGLDVRKGHGRYNFVRSAPTDDQRPAQ